MTKKKFSQILLAVMFLMNIYMLYRITNDTATISSYDAGISQRTGVGRLESFWTKYTGGSKKFEVTYEDRLKAESDKNTSAIVLIGLNVVLIAAIYWLNKKPAVAPPPPLTVEERRELRLERKRRNSR